jgi:hypothetical protein
MSNYQPPTENVPVFNSELFETNNTPLTYETASKSFLKYPNAQGAENLQAINVNGVLTANSTSNFNKALTMSSTNQADRIIRASYYRVKDTGNVDARWSEISHTFNSMGFSNICNGGDIQFKLNKVDGSQITSLFLDPVNTTINNNCTINGPLIVNATSDFKENLLLNNGTDLNKRAIRSTFYYFYDTSNNPQATTPTTIGSIYNENGTFYIVNSIANGNFNVVLRDSLNAQYFPLQILPSGTTLRSTLGIAANFNLNMAAGTGVINQPRVSGDTTTANNLKKTIISLNSGSALGSGNTALDVLDNFNNKGLFVLCNSGAGSLSPTNRAGDVVIGSRNEDNGCITISNYNNNYQNGMRVFTTKSTGIDNCATILYNGQSSTGDWAEFNMSYDRITQKQTTTFNQPINFAPTTMNSNRRALNGLGYLNFIDISNNGLGNFQNNGGRYNSSIWTNSFNSFDISNFGFGMMFDNEMPNGSYNFITRNLLNEKLVSLQIKPDVISLYKTLRFNTGGASTDRDIIGVGTIVLTDTFGGGSSSSIQATTNTLEPISGMIYDCNIDGGFHIFKCNDTGGNETSPVYYGANLTSVSNTFIVRNATTPSNRLDFTTDSLIPNTTIRSRSTVSGTNASITFSCDTVTALGVVITLPNCVLAPFTFEMKRAIQLNYITTPFNNTQLGFVSSTSFTATNYSSQASPTNIGSVTLGVGTWNILVNFQFSNTGNHTYTQFAYGIGTSATAFTNTAPYNVSYIRDPNISINNATISRQVSLNLQLLTSTIIYFNEQVIFSGGGLCTIGGVYNITRIG